MTPNNRRQEQTDEQLLWEYKITGDEKVFAKLYVRYVALVIGVCCNYLNNIEDAEDECQNIYITKREIILNTEIKNFRSWLHRVTINHCLDMLKLKKPIVVGIDENKISDLVEIDDNTRLTIMLGKETNDKNINECVDNLPLGQKECIKRFHFKEQCYKRIAEETGFSVRDVTTLIQNGRRNLRVCMENKINEL